MSTEDDQRTWMTLEEVTKYPRVSRSKLYDLAQSGEIPCSKVAGRVALLSRQRSTGMLKQRPARKSEAGADDGA